MPVPHELQQWIKQRYPKPEIDQEWLSECYSYVQSQGHARGDPNSAVEVQLLASDLRDSTVPRTAIPVNFKEIGNTRLTGPFLVQIMALTDIGHSAFSLQNTRQIRIERADLSALAVDAEDEEEGPVPNYPRGMLRFELSDGSTVFPAIEYRKIPQIALGVTPLGCKLLLKNILVRNGIAFLEPNTVTIKGSSVEELEAVQDIEFVKSLKRRLGKPEAADENGPTNLAQNQNTAVPVVGQARRIEPPATGQQLNPQTQTQTEPSVRIRPGMVSQTTTNEETIVQESPYFRADASTSTQNVSPLDLPLANVSSRAEQAPTSSRNLNGYRDYSSDPDFRMASDDMDADFFAELDCVEQRALNSQTNIGITTAQEVEVIDIEHSSDKENISLSQIHSMSQRRRFATPANEVIDISD